MATTLLTSDAGQRVLETSSPGEALGWVHSLAPSDPVAYSVMSSVTERYAEDPASAGAARWWAVTDADGAPSLAAMQTLPEQAHVPTTHAEDVALLAAALAGPGRPAVPSIGGPADAAHAFAVEYARRRALRSRVVEAKGVLVLDDAATLPHPVRGQAATPPQDDASGDLLTRWHVGFLEDVGEGARAAGAGVTVARHLAAGRIRVWQVEGRPVSMAWTTPPAAGVVRVSGVYTPPELRGHGYASGLVHAMSREQQSAGHRCMLYTQLSNPTSNKIYESIGYRRIADDLHIVFS